MKNNDKDSVDKIASLLSQELYDYRDYGRGREQNTIKSYIRRLSSRVTGYIANKEQDKFNDQYRESFSLTCLAVISSILLMNGFRSNPGFDFIQENQLIIQLWGVVLATIYVGASIERSSLFRTLWEFSSTKIIASLSFSAVVIYSTGKSAYVINEVFGVDASTFPVTYAFTTAIIVFDTISSFLFALSLLIVLHISDIFGWFWARYKGHSYDFPSFHSFAFTILASVIMYFGWAWSNHELGSETLPGKVYIIASNLDFNSNNKCSNIDDSKPVVFIGENQNAVLVDESEIAVEEFEDFFNAKLKPPKNFVRNKCLYY